MSRENDYPSMKLTAYRPSLFRQPLAWLYWHILGRSRKPRSLRDYTPDFVAVSSPSVQETDVTQKARGGPSLFLRHLDCGSCNGCELALHAVNTPLYDLPGHGIHFVASPRHANFLVITGPLTYNLKEIVITTLEQLPEQRIITVGDCAISNNEAAPFRGAYGVIPREEWPEALNGAIVQEIPGCPPDPNKILEALIKQARDDNP